MGDVGSWIAGRGAGWRRIRRRDVVIAAAVALIEIGGTRGIVHHQGPAHRGCWWGSCAPMHLGAGAYVLLALGPLALLGRRLYPRAVLGVVFAVTVAYAVSGYPAGPVFLSLIVAFATVIVRGHRWLGWTAVAAGWAAFLWLPAAFGTDRTPGAVPALALAAWLLALLAGSEAVRSRRERGAALRRSREADERRRAEQERLRIARELHDVLAHHISLINVQSGVALHLLDEQPQQARSALSVINEASAEALREMRAVLGMLRRVDEQPAPLAPAAGLDRLGELVSRSAAAGVAVQVRTEGQARALPAGVDLAAYRIIQESLTNVVRHAGAGEATVRLRYGEHALTLEIDDRGAAAVNGHGGAGHGGRGAADDGDSGAASHGGNGENGGGNGIAGMRERAVALGGTLEAGPRGDGGFRVLARLPLGRRA